MAFGISATALAIGGSALVGAYAANRAAGSQAQAAGEATQAQRDIANQQVALQREQYNKNLELNAPFREAGLTAQNKLLGYLGLGEGDGRYARDFSMADYQADPGYAFRLSEGTKALDRTAAARGGLLSGAALKGAQRYGQDLASQEYQNAFNRYQVNRSNQLNPLQSLMGAGQTATGQDIAMGSNYAGNVGNALGAYGSAAAGNMIGAGNARASGYMGMANTASGALGQGLNFYQNQNLLNTLLANRGVGGGGGGGMGGYISSSSPGYNLSPAMFDVPDGV
jgi:hypothetical protein